MSGTPPISRQGSVSIRGSNIRSPAADLHLQHAVYARNIQNLESQAEELSASGSDLGEAILKMSRANSIQSSQNGDISVVRPSVLARMGSSHSSKANSARRSIVDVNGAARWGGYSPNGVVTSPVGSTSGSWSQASLSRVTSASRSSRLAHMNEPMQEGRPLDSPTLPDFEHEEPTSPHSRGPSGGSFARRYDEIAGQIQESLQHVPSSQHTRNVSVHSQEAAILEEAEGSITPERPRSTDTYREAQLAFKDFDGVHFDPDTDEFIELDEQGNELRRVSARSSSGGMSFEAASLLRSSGGQRLSQGAAPPLQQEGMTYYPAPVPKVLNLPKRMSLLPASTVQSKRRTQLLDDMSPEAKAAAPWLGEERVDGDGNRMSASHKRHSASINSLPRGMLNERMSRDVGNLPPHARASLYFDPPPVKHDIELKEGSAVATLDSILDASATAPPTAFTDHPYAGDVRKSVFSMEKQQPKPQRQSTGTTSSHSSPKEARRKSSFGALFKRNASSDQLDAMSKKNGSRGSVLMDADGKRKPNKLKKRKSQMSVGDELDEVEERPQTSGTLGSDLQGSNRGSGLIASAQNAPLPEGEEEGPEPYRTSDMYEDGAQIDNDFKEEEAQDEAEDDGEVSFVKPATLLAELQVRKAQQKSRGKTAATAFPQGMHSTLLQMDAVDEILKKKRKQQRIELAWEDPQQRAMDKDDDAEDDVPLGMLFPGKLGKPNRAVGDGKDMDRPLGLIEKRHLEDNEPLSSRRNRLRGISPVPGNSARGTPNASQLNLAGRTNAAEGAEAEDEDETLAQRRQRMAKAKEATRVGDSKAEAKEEGGLDSHFAADILATLHIDKDEVAGQADAQKPAASAAPAEEEEEEETLGQRRARLQREREASGEQAGDAATASRPPLNTANSFGTLLTANPVGQRQAVKNYQPRQSTLLGNNASQEARQRSQLIDTNKRASSYTALHPSRTLVNGQQQQVDQANPGSMLAAEHNRAATLGGFGMYNNGMGGVQMPMSTGTPTAAMRGANSYFASPTAGYGYNTMMGYQQMQAPMQQMFQPQFTNPLAYAALTGGAMMSPAPGMGHAFMGNAYNPGMMGGTYASYLQNMGATGMGMGGVDEQLTNSQRSAIDQWRAGIGR